jgi:hypothetical protein
VSEEKIYDHGPQPLDQLMTAREMSNHVLVGHSTEPLTHKQIQKARSGRRLTPKLQKRITKAYNLATTSELKVTDLFNYIG